MVSRHGRPRPRSHAREGFDGREVWPRSLANARKLTPRANARRHTHTHTHTHSASLSLSWRCGIAPPSSSARARVRDHSPLEECMAALAFCSLDFCSFGGILLLVCLPSRPRQSHCDLPPQFSPRAPQLGASPPPLRFHYSRWKECKSLLNFLLPTRTAGGGGGSPLSVEIPNKIRPRSRALLWPGKGEKRRRGSTHHTEHRKSALATSERK